MESSVDSASANRKGEWLSRTKAFFARCWRGKASCSEAFWLLLVSGHVALYITNVLFVLLLTMVNAILKSTSPGAAETGAVVFFAWILVFGIAHMVYVAFALISVWRCAPNTERRAHTVLARVVVLAIVAVMLLMFLDGIRRGTELIEQRRGGVGAALDSGGYRMVGSWPTIVRCGYTA